MHQFEDRIQQVTRFWNRAENLLQLFGKFNPGSLSEDFGDSTIIDVSDVLRERLQDPNATAYLILLDDETDEVHFMDLEWKVGNDSFVASIDQNGKVNVNYFTPVAGDVTDVLKQAHEYLHRIELICFERQSATSGRIPNETDNPQPAATGVGEAESRAIDVEVLSHTAGLDLAKFREELLQSLLDGTINPYEEAILPTSGDTLAAIVQGLAGTKLIIPTEEGSTNQILQKGAFDYWINFRRTPGESGAEISLRVGQRGAPGHGVYDLTTLGLELRRVSDRALAQVDSDIEVLLFTNLEVGATYVFAER